MLLSFSNFEYFTRTAFRSLHRGNLPVPSFQLRTSPLACFVRHKIFESCPGFVVQGTAVLHVVGNSLCQECLLWCRVVSAAVRRTLAHI